MSVMTRFFAATALVIACSCSAALPALAADESSASAGDASLATVEPGKRATLQAGTYVGGVDLPVGTYILSCEEGAEDSGRVWVAAAEDDLDEGYPSYLYEYVEQGEVFAHYAPVQWGGIIRVEFPCTLTSVDVYDRNFSEATELPAGTYIGGVDLPTGTYVVSREKGEEDTGRVWVASPDDDLEEEYPSYLYEYIDEEEAFAYYAPLQEGGTLEVEFPFTLTSIDLINADFSKSVEIPAGTYIGGVDLPADVYVIAREGDAGDSGRVWVAAAEDNLDEEYPSYLYEFIDEGEIFSYHAPLHEGGTLRVEFPCTLTRDVGVVFE